MSFLYQPASAGGWLAFAADTRLLIVGDSVDADFIEPAWGAIAAEAGFQSVLDLLTRRGLTATPPFALFEWSSPTEVRSIVRGNVTVAIASKTGDQSVTGTGVSTWIESSFTEVTGVAIAVQDATAMHPESLPLHSGVAFASLISTGESAAVAKVAPPASSDRKAAPGPQPAAEPAAKPAPAPAPPATAGEDVEATRTDAPGEERAADKTAADKPALEKSATEKPGAEKPAAAEPMEAEPAPGASDGYDYLFGDTMYRSVADAAVHEPDPEKDEPVGTSPAADPAEGDHDGHTVLTADIAKLRTGRKGRKTAVVAPTAAPTQNIVLSLPTGTREPLTQSILVGRAPSANKVSGGSLPKLVTLGGADQDISRNHAQFALEGDTVVVTDLHSKNGTIVVLPGKSPQKLRAGEPTAVIVGTVVDLGGGITLTIEEA